VHPVVPACDTVNVCPATVTVPVRAVDVLAVTLNVTVPLPFPLPPDITLIHGALVTAVHTQPLEVVTDVVVVPPAAAIDALLVDSA
jgi:hypothetical protein